MDTPKHTLNRRIFMKTALATYLSGLLPGCGGSGSDNPKSSDTPLAQTVGEPTGELAIHKAGEGLGFVYTQDTDTMTLFLPPMHRGFLRV